MKIQEIGLKGQTIYSLAPTSDLRTLYVGLDSSDIRVFDLVSNSKIGNYQDLFYFSLKF
jgi:hypothetical protein